MSEFSSVKNDKWLSVILKLPGEVCNINCVYCYEKRRPYENNKFMNPNDVTKFLNLFNGRPLSIELHGGEPLILGKKRLEPILKSISDYQGEKKVSIQTNGVLLDEGWITFLKAHIKNLEIGISLDGDSIVNNYRLDYNGNNTTTQVENSIKLLEKMNVNIGIISVVTKQTINYPIKKFLDYFSEYSNIKNIKFAPCMDYNVATKKRKSNIIALRQNTGEGHADWAISPTEYSTFINTITNYWLDYDYFEKFLIEPSISIIRTIANKSTTFCHFNNQKCNYVLTLYPDGRIGSCDELPIGIAYHGHLNDIESESDLYNIIENEKVNSTIEKIMKKCNTCSYKNTCGGGCIATRYRYLNTEYYEEYCEHRVSMIENINTKINQIENKVN